MSYQVTCRVAWATKADFDSYADALGLEASGLAKLLLRREQRHRQLSKFLNDGGNIKPDPKPTRSADMPTITAHYAISDPVIEFTAYAASCGLSRAKAGAWIFQRELEERWLEKALLSEPESDGG